MSGHWNFLLIKIPGQIEKKSTSLFIKSSPTDAFLNPALRPIQDQDKATSASPADVRLKYITAYFYFQLTGAAPDST